MDYTINKNDIKKVIFEDIKKVIFEVTKIKLKALKNCYDKNNLIITSAFNDKEYNYIYSIHKIDKNIITILFY